MMLMTLKCCCAIKSSNVSIAWHSTASTAKIVCTYILSVISIVGEIHLVDAPAIEHVVLMIRRQFSLWNNSAISASLFYVALQHFKTEICLILTFSCSTQKIWLSAWPGE